MKSFPPKIAWQFYYDFRTGKKVFADDAEEFCLKDLAKLERELQDAKSKDKAQWVIDKIQNDMDYTKSLLDEIEQQKIDFTVELPEEPHET